MGLAQRLVGVCEEVLAPLVHADGGQLWLVSSDGDTIALHLAGMCAGCPGVSLTTRDVIEPALRAIAPSVRITVTAGISVPPRARLVVPSSRLSTPPPLE